jgi:hypothetical protein
LDARHLERFGVPDQNRVTPLGKIVAAPLRCAWTGNRGILHSGKTIVRFHTSDLWITCALRFAGRWQPQWQPRHYTFLYFHDEAVSFAAGHRPCAECRRDDYDKYRDAWSTALGTTRPSAKHINAQLHTERIVRGTHRRRTHEMDWARLPDGVFVLVDETPSVIIGSELVEWTAAGYGRRYRRPSAGTAIVVTPPSAVAVLRAGYPVQIDGSATR